MSDTTITRDASHDREAVEIVCGEGLEQISIPLFPITGDFQKKLNHYFSVFYSEQSRASYCIEDFINTVSHKQKRQPTFFWLSIALSPDTSDEQK